MKRVLLLAMLLAGCSDESAAKSTLSKAGFRDIETTGWSPMSCGEDDTTSTGFTATNPSGEKVKGVVCCGLIFKACTVRF